MAKIKYSLLSGMPKSGCIALSTFLDRYCANQQDPKFKDNPALYIDRNTLFDKVDFYISHNECPGFAVASPEHFKLWQDLSYSDGLPWRMSSQCLSHINKALTDGVITSVQECRIAYVYRNPLDQVLSNFKYIMKYPKDAETVQLHEQPYADFTKFALADAIGGYIKNFYTYYIMQRKYPEVILMVSYEEMISNRAAALRKILDHLEIPFHETAFYYALEKSSIEVMAELPPMKYHIHNGGVGVWQNVMSVDLVLQIEERLQRFGLSLRMFHVADDLKPEFAFLRADTTALSPLRYTV